LEPLEPVMMPGRSTCSMTEAMMDPVSTSVTRPEWEPEAYQRPIIQPEPESEKTPTGQPRPEAQQGFNTQQKPASQQRPLTQQKPIVQHEAKYQQEPIAQQSAVHQEFLAPQESVPQQLPSIHNVHSEQQEGASQQGPGPGTTCSPSGSVDPSLAQQEVGSIPTAQGIPGPKKGPSTQIKSTSSKGPEQSDLTAQPTPPVQDVKSKQGFSTQGGFLTRMHEVFTQRSSQEGKTFFEWVTDFDTESDVNSSSETNPLVVGDRTVTPGVKPEFPKKPSYEKASTQNHKNNQDTGESEPGGMEIYCKPDQLRSPSNNPVR
uniref:Uncharacterized protein n=1 Tax=Castor canadensis TaxID=51338 RepID=A0A8C0X335_CASCN